jgi:hypothetical protein
MEKGCETSNVALSLRSPVDAVTKVARVWMQTRLDGVEPGQPSLLSLVVKFENESILATVDLTRDPTE